MEGKEKRGKERKRKARKGKERQGKERTCFAIYCAVMERRTSFRLHRTFFVSLYLLVTFRCLIWMNKSYFQFHSYYEYSIKLYTDINHDYMFLLKLAIMKSVPDIVILNMLKVTHLSIQSTSKPWNQTVLRFRSHCSLRCSFTNTNVIMIC